MDLFFISLTALWIALYLTFKRKKGKKMAYPALFARL